MAELGFLRPQERRTVGMGLAVVALIGAGFWLRGFVAPAEAAQVTKVEQIAATQVTMAKDINDLKLNMGRVMDRMSIPREPELPLLRPSGIGR
jgi:hypothetical protein